MKIKMQIEKEYDVEFLHVEAGVRYWEDAEVNGVEDSDGELIPCREGDSWCPKIHIESGKILSWEQGKTAYIHYKICDSGTYKLVGKDGEIILTKNSYVPDILCPNGDGYGDYIILKVDENGFIQDWKPDVESVIDMQGF